MKKDEFATWGAFFIIPVIQEEGKNQVNIQRAMPVLYMLLMRNSFQKLVHRPANSSQFKLNFKKNSTI